MAFLDIEKVINRKNIGSRFKLVHLAGLRAKELNNPKEDTANPNMKEGVKVTSQALCDLVGNNVIFTEIIENEQNEPTGLEETAKQE